MHHARRVVKALAADLDWSIDSSGQVDDHDGLSLKLQTAIKPCQWSDRRVSALHALMYMFRTRRKTKIAHGRSVFRNPRRTAGHYGHGPAGHRFLWITKVGVKTGSVLRLCIEVWIGHDNVLLLPLLLCKARVA